jgi:hypothetical protein
VQWYSTGVIWPPRSPCCTSEGPQAKVGKMGGHGNCLVGLENFTFKIKLLITEKEIKMPQYI